MSCWVFIHYGHKRLRDQTFVHNTLTLAYYREKKPPSVFLLIHKGVTNKKKKIIFFRQYSYSFIRFSDSVKIHLYATNFLELCILSVQIGNLEETSKKKKYKLSTQAFTFMPTCYYYIWITALLMYFKQFVYINFILCGFFGIIIIHYYCDEILMKPVIGMWKKGIHRSHTICFFNSGLLLNKN